MNLHVHFSGEENVFQKKIKEKEFEKKSSKLYNIKNIEMRLFFLKDKIK